MKNIILSDVTPQKLGVKSSSLQENHTFLKLRTHCRQQKLIYLVINTQLFCSTKLFSEIQPLKLHKSTFLWVKNKCHVSIIL